MDIEKRILKLLKKEGEGVTVSDLAKKSKLHRHTIAKYIYKLESQKKIKIREIGRAKLCYLNFENKNKKGISNLVAIMFVTISILSALLAYADLTGYFIYENRINPVNISKNLSLQNIQKIDNNFLELYFENETSFTADFLVDNNGTYNLSLITKFTTPLHLR
ncbi:MAG: HTH domain-containing protein, partial [Candidatus Aenigmarchaeota archaeon]|nr:HTH domain-containing protein [Candidatus Aenigmarchaeota archaeon]